ncbi:spore protease YyaC [Paenibacillus sp. GYB004]|uniref:spore protease YyaC n=1 Tax=Paenibacillus sp. GYB004 TaxID=2994393 RepID=UPI002F963B05
MNGDTIRHKVKGEELPEFFKYIREQGAVTNDLVFVCIGTDRSTGDALGPLVGTMLSEMGYRHVIGTLESPCDASNLLRRLGEIPPNKVTIAVDACLGLPASIGYFQVANQPIYPGKSVGKTLPPVGSYSIAAIVNTAGPKQYWKLQSTSLYRVISMAKEIAAAVRSVFPV